MGGRTSTRNFGWKRPKHRLEDNIKMYIGEIVYKVVNLIELAQGKIRRQTCTFGFHNNSDYCVI
jgi:hypothetical protein